MRAKTKVHPQLQAILKEVWRRYLQPVIQYWEYRLTGPRAIY